MICEGCKEKGLLFQNSMRATVELYEDKKEAYPAVKTLVTLGKEDLSIKVTALVAHTLELSVYVIVSRHCGIRGKGRKLTFAERCICKVPG